MIKLNLSYMNKGVYYESNDLKDGLANTYAAIGDLPYEILEIDVNGIRDAVKSAKAVDFVAALEEVKIPRSACTSEYKPLCESILFETLVAKYFDGIVPKCGEPISPPKFKNKLFFIGDEKGWVVVKKMSISPDTSAREAAAFMLGIKASVLAKYLELKCPNSKEIVERVVKKFGKKRKSMAVLRELFEEYGKDRMAFIVGAGSLGYSLTPNHDTLKKVFSELKLPGIKGRKPK